MYTVNMIMNGYWMSLWAVSVFNFFKSLESATYFSFYLDMDSGVLEIETQFFNENFYHDLIFQLSSNTKLGEIYAD